MEKQRKKLAINILIWSFLAFFNCLVFADMDAPDEQEQDYHSGEVFVDQKQLENAGIELQTLNNIKFTPEFICFGEVIDITPLIKAKINYQLALVKMESAAKSFAFHQKNLNRVQKLHQNKAISKRKMQEQLEKWRLSKMQLHKTKLGLELAKEMIILNWGADLYDWVSKQEHAKLSSIIAGNKKIILVSLSANGTLSTTSKIFIHQAGIRNLAIMAKLIGSSPKIRGLTQGESYFFLANDPRLRTGMQVTAWIPKQTQLFGVMIPNSALVRHLGQSFVYLEATPHYFIRYQISAPELFGNNYFVADTKLVGKKIVKTGVQLLLAEEFRDQIPEEDDDD